MPSSTAYTIYAFGLTSFLFGAVTLLDPIKGAERLDLDPSAQPVVKASSLAAIAMGIYYILAAYQENHAFFWLTVPMRTLTTTVFLRQGGGWTGPGIWEGLGATATALALIVTRPSPTRMAKKEI